MNFSEDILLRMYPGFSFIPRGVVVRIEQEISGEAGGSNERIEPPDWIRGRPVPRVLWYL
jgi:hypothetical protein